MTAGSESEQPVDQDRPGDAAPSAADGVPVFVAVGNVNQGKSSVVAALSENETIPIDSYPGTTIHSGTYVFRVGDRVLFRIVDTPGFQRAREALAWLRERAGSAAERAAAVTAFVEEHEGRDEFKDEVELLRPILAGAGILYVVDASSRFQPANEAEMEILRWTGSPGMALINRIRERDHADEWRPVLEQFFNIVREFDAHGARFEDRIGLLQGFREIRHRWREPIDAAIEAMRAEWNERRKRSAGVLADLMTQALAQVERQRLDEGDDEAAARRALEQRYRDAQRKLEREARDEVERIHRHPELDRDEGGQALELLHEDLFSETSWRLFGLTRAQLLRYGAAWGAVIGGAIDLMVGGLSMFLGAGIGAGVGAAAGWFGGTDVARIWGGTSKLKRALLPGETGRFLAMGPVQSPRYAWMLLDRALTHYRAVRDRSHARRDVLALGDAELRGVAAALPAELRDDLDRALREVLKEALKGGVSTETRIGLGARLERVLAQLLPA